jgi:6-phosphogluconolactonase (cycloisomerase 2 family)
MGFRAVERGYSRAKLSLGIAVAGVSLLLAAAGPAYAGGQNDVFVSNQGTDYTANSSVSQFTLGGGGLLSAHGSAPAGVGPWDEAISSNAKFLYLIDYFGDHLSQYRITSAGTLAALSPAELPTGPVPFGVAASPDGRNVYVTNVEGSPAITVYKVGADGGLSAVQSETTGVDHPTGVAVSPDGRSVYVANANGPDSNVLEYNRASDGKLTPKPVPSVAAGYMGVSNMSIAPNGHSLYVLTNNLPVLDQYTIGNGGELTPMATPTVTLSGDTQYSPTISPDGKSLYVADCLGHNILQFNIGPSGSLTPKANPAVTTGQCPAWIWFTASGRSAYAAVDSLSYDGSGGFIGQFNASTTGLSPKTPASVPDNHNPAALMIPPDTGPIASFSAKAWTAKEATRFNASKSSSPGGRIARYEWSFGDGHRLRNGGARPRHTYRQPGTYRVTLTVLDSSGCSRALVFTGQTAYCGADKRATVVRHVKIRRAASAAKPVFTG